MDLCLNGGMLISYNILTDYRNIIALQETENLR